MKKQHKKRKINKFGKLIIFIIIITILIISSWTIYNKINPNNPFTFFETTSTKLEKIGYTKEEIENINKLNNQSLHYILTSEYITKLNELITNEKFKEENLEKYQKALNLYNLSVEDTIYLVNNENYDETKTYTETAIKLMQSKYYINNNYDRYITYQEKNSKLEIDKIISDVNTNLDYEYYTNTKKTDTSKGYLMLVNKYNYLESSYVPKNLVNIPEKYGRANLQVEKTTYENFVKMYDAAMKENLRLYVTSPYRSYQTQANLYTNYVNRDGVKEADTYSARAGYSEHQTGLAMDILTPGATMDNFEKNDVYKWLKENSYKYGFILRYPKDKEDITGYMFESWHYRYVGTEVAKIIYENDITFDEYYAYYVK